MLDIEIYRRRLLVARQELLRTRRVREESTATVELDQSRTGRLSRMDALQAQAISRAGRERAEAADRRIDLALARCDAGDFGYCLSCGEPIDPRRLDADPTTPLCLTCAEEREGR